MPRHIAIRGILRVDRQMINFSLLLFFFLCIFCYLCNWVKLVVWKWQISTMLIGKDYVLCHDRMMLIVSIFWNQITKSADDLDLTAGLLIRGALIRVGTGDAAAFLCLKWLHWLFWHHGVNDHIYFMLGEGVVEEGAMLVERKRITLFRTAKAVQIEIIFRHRTLSFFLLISSFRFFIFLKAHDHWFIILYEYWLN